MSRHKDIESLNSKIKYRRDQIKIMTQEIKELRERRDALIEERFGVPAHEHPYGRTTDGD